MRIAIRKELNGLIYIDKNLQEYIDYTLPPYNFMIITIDDIYEDCEGNDFNEDLTFSVDKYNARKQAENKFVYENKIVIEIRKKYTVNQELAILRQRDTKPEEFEIYNTYVEECKAKVKTEIGG